MITIDGPAGVGKSTVAKLLARRLGLLYLDTGATYRALAYHALRQGADPRSEAAIIRLVRSARIRLRQAASGARVLLNGEDVTQRIRTERVTEAAAAIAQHPRVRSEMVRLQRRLAESDRVIPPPVAVPRSGTARPARRAVAFGDATGGGIIAEGRDTGTVVFPKARYKFFLTARTTIRARRRQSELRTVQGDSPALAMIAKQLRHRDRLDRTRAVGPLIKPPGAIELDTTSLSVDEVVGRMLDHLPRFTDIRQGSADSEDRVVS